MRNALIFLICISIVAIPTYLPGEEKRARRDKISSSPNLERNINFKSKTSGADEKDRDKDDDYLDTVDDVLDQMQELINRVEYQDIILWQQYLRRKSQTWFPQGFDSAFKQSFSRIKPKKGTSSVQPSKSPKRRSSQTRSSRRTREPFKTHELGKLSIKKIGPRGKHFQISSKSSIAASQRAARALQAALR
jgi:hypothetical protein